MQISRRIPVEKGSLARNNSFKIFNGKFDDEGVLPGQLMTEITFLNGFMILFFYILSQQDYCRELC